jgi:hypothetical protein
MKTAILLALTVLSLSALTASADQNGEERVYQCLGVSQSGFSFWGDYKDVRTDAQQSALETCHQQSSQDCSVLACWSQVNGGYVRSEPTTH